ncbi:MAG: glycosyltransferase family 2 protein [Muribaculaceae bacterium]|nr:glycosyltransferase family 2 protein [Muribaculaceae bacterium]
MSERPRISAIVQTYNAQQHLDRCLSALERFDEILVVDMESTDATAEIAARHGARFIVKERGEHRIVEAYRDFAIHAAAYDWVLIVDSDEIVPSALADYLYSAIESDPSPRAFLIPIRNYFMGRWMRSNYPDYILRFFNRRGAHWPYELHSRPTHLGPRVRIPASRKDLAFIHLANESEYQRIAKMNAYTEGEKDRRRSRYRRIRFLYEPAFRFLKSYVIKGGFRDGMPGFINAVHDAMYRFTILAKLEEECQNACPGKDIDRDTARIER